GRIAFTHFQHDSFTIAVMHADGTHLRTVADRGRISSFGPDWSPDGTSIAFTTFTKDGRSVIDIVDDHSRPLRRVPIVFSADTIENAFVPSWSPDGPRLLFTGQPL